MPSWAVRALSANFGYGSDVSRPALDIWSTKVRLGERYGVFLVDSDIHLSNILVEIEVCGNGISEPFDGLVSRRERLALFTKETFKLTFAELLRDELSVPDTSHCELEAPGNAAPRTVPLQF